jgi:hypothetical protein
VCFRFIRINKAGTLTPTFHGLSENEKTTYHYLHGVHYYNLPQSSNHHLHCSTPFPCKFHCHRAEGATSWLLHSLMQAVAYSGCSLSYRLPGFSKRSLIISTPYAPWRITQLRLHVYNIVHNYLFTLVFTSLLQHEHDSNEQTNEPKNEKERTPDIAISSLYHSPSVLSPAHINFQPIAEPHAYQRSLLTPRTLFASITWVRNTPLTNSCFGTGRL